MPRPSKNQQNQLDADKVGPEKISPALIHLAVPIESLAYDPDNARLHPQRSIEVIADSLRTFGQKKSIVVRQETMTVVAGNGTLEAARSLGWLRIAANVESMTDAEAIAYGLADNRTAEESTWNYEVVQRQAALLAELGQTPVGWGSEELENIRIMEFFPVQFPEVDENIETEHVCPKCGYAFSGGEIRESGTEVLQEEEDAKAE